MKKLLILYIILISVNLQAQQVKDTVKTEVINVTRSFEPKVQDAYKLDINPEIDQTNEKKIPVDFHIQSVPVASTFTPEKGGMAKFNAGNIIEDVYKSYAALSAGNYTQIQADTYLYYPVNNKLGSALRLSHYSSQGQKKEYDNLIKPFYHTTADMLFDYKTDQSRWNIDLGYNGHIHYLQYYYHAMPQIAIYPVPIVNTYKHNDNNFEMTINGHFKNLFLNNIQLSYNNYWDNFDNSENSVQLATDLKFAVGSLDLKIGLLTDLISGYSGKVHFVQDYPETTIAYKNIDFGIAPAIQIENDNLVIDAGAKIYYQNQDTLYKNLQFIPDIKAGLNLIYEKLTVFAGVTGNLKQNSYHELTKQNPYLRPENIILPTLTPYDIFGGFSGAFSSSFSYEIKLGVRKIKNYPFYNFSYINWQALIGYNILYDDMNQSYFDTSFNIGVGKKFDLKLNLTYLQNDPEHMKKALFIPDFSFKSILIFHPTDKININATLRSIGNRTYSNTSDSNLNGFTDINLGIRYNINKQFTAFLQSNNLLGDNYQIFFGYPVQKLQILGGVAYRFDIPKFN